MLTRISRILLVFAVILIAAIYIPRYYWKIFDKRTDKPFVLYSVVVNDFLISRAEGRVMAYMDSKGNRYTRSEYEQLLPLFNYRQLISNGTMPDSLNGVKLEISEVRKNNIFIRLKPTKILKPQIPLYPLFESQSGRVQLEMPDAYFRINSRMEFINASTNRLNEELTRMFTDTLIARGFVFPAKLIAGNPTTRKPFDEGYFVVDAENKTFHIKMVKGKPFCRNTHFPRDLQIRSIFVKEMGLREFYAILISEDNNVYLISYDDYRLIHLPLEEYDYTRTNLLFLGNMFIRNFLVINRKGMVTIVTDRNYRLIDTYRESWKSRDERTAGKVAEYLFPFTLNLVSPYSRYVNFYIRYPTFKSLLGILFFVVIALLVLRYKNQPLKQSWMDVLIVLFGGVYGLIAILIFEDIGKKF